MAEDEFDFGALKKTASIPDQKKKEEKFEVLKEYKRQVEDVKDEQQKKVERKKKVDKPTKVEVTAPAPLTIEMIRGLLQEELKPVNALISDLKAFITEKTSNPDNAGPAFKLSKFESIDSLRMTYQILFGKSNRKLKKSGLISAIKEKVQ